MTLEYMLRVEKSLQSIYRPKDFTRVCSFVRLFRWQDIQNDGTKMRSGSNTKVTSYAGDARRRRRGRRLCLMKRTSSQRRNSVEFAIERSIRSRMNTERSSNNRQSSAKKLIRIGKLLKLIPRGRCCWQTFLSPFMRVYCSWPIHLRFGRKRYDWKTNSRFIVWKYCKLS